jgi:hypothetical protein
LCAPGEEAVFEDVFEPSPRALYLSPSDEGLNSTGARALMGLRIEDEAFVFIGALGECVE